MFLEAFSRSFITGVNTAKVDIALAIEARIPRGCHHLELESFWSSRFSP